jgi:hypothetical protein
VQVKWERQPSQYLTLVVNGGAEIHHQVRPYGSSTQPLTEEDGTAPADGLPSAMTKSAAVRAVTSWSLTAPECSGAVRRWSTGEGSAP